MGEALNKAQYNENSQEEPNSEKKPSEIEGKAEISSKEKETIKISKEEKELAKQKDKEEYERVHALVESARDTAQNVPLSSLTSDSEKHIRNSGNNRFHNKRDKRHREDVRRSRQK